MTHEDFTVIATTVMGGCGLLCMCVARYRATIHKRRLEMEQTRAVRELIREQQDPPQTEYRRQALNFVKSIAEGGPGGWIPGITIPRQPERQIDPGPRCTNCNRHLQGGCKFCPRCGTQVQWILIENF